MSVNQIEGLWSPEEDQMLLNFIEKHGINWSLISKSIPGRSDLSCWSRWLSLDFVPRPEEDETNLIEGPWSFEEDEMLLYCAWEYDRNWLLVRESIPGRSGLSCMSRWLTLQRSFTPEEDEMLLNLVEKHSHNWSLVISESIPGRSGLSCVSRWMSLFRPYTPEEDQMLLNLFMEYGRNWSLISESIPGRSALSCESRWSLLTWKGISWTNEHTTIVSLMNVTKTYLLRNNCIRINILRCFIFFTASLIP